MSAFKLIESVLGGIYGAQIGLSDEEAAATLKKDLDHAPFREGIEKEITEAFTSSSVSWKALLNDNEVSHFATEEDAENFAKEILWDAVFPNESLPKKED